MYKSRRYLFMDLEILKERYHTLLKHYGNSTNTTMDFDRVLNILNEPKYPARAIIHTPLKHGCFKPPLGPPTNSQELFTCIHFDLCEIGVDGKLVQGWERNHKLIFNKSDFTRRGIL